MNILHYIKECHNKYKVSPNSPHARRGANTILLAAKLLPKPQEGKQKLRKPQP